ncbi:hypothetical protein PTKIN_Ptkin01aG0090800 [Pterospermum kingtungense]
MAKSIVSLPILCILLLLSFNPGGLLKLADGQDKTWCVAKPSSDDTVLVNNLKYACENIEESCRPIQPGEACYYPNTPINHASVAMNIYYQGHGHQPSQCYFDGSGLITISDPSYGSCQYA